MRFELNLDIGRPVAFIRGDPRKGNKSLNNEIVHVTDVDSAEGGTGRVVDNDTERAIDDYFRKLKKKLNPIDVTKLHKALSTRTPPDSDHLFDIYQSALQVITGSKGREISLEVGGPDRMELTFDPFTERQVFYITGMSGSGKSTLTGKLMENYHKLYPDNEVYLFSNKTEDPALDIHNFMTRVPMDSDLYEYPIILDALKNSLVIFDDVEAIIDKKLATEIDRLKDLILQQGRSYHVSFIYISHLANDYRRTRTILNEAHSITVFPRMCSQYSLKYLLEKYLGFSNKDSQRLFGLPSRWVTIHKAPITVVHEYGCYLLQ